MKSSQMEKATYPDCMWTTAGWCLQVGVTRRTTGRLPKLLQPRYASESVYLTFCRQDPRV